MKVDILSSDLARNCLGRAVALADVLAHDHDVRILGTRFGHDIWPPAQDHPVDIVEVPGAKWPAYRRAFGKLIDLIDADVVLAVKPLLPSYGAALLARRRAGVPIVLDIDDDEVALSPLPAPWEVPNVLVDPDGAFARRAVHRLIPRADATVVASRALQRRFGGHLVRHAKDTEALRPLPRSAGDAWRNELGLGGARVVLFLGTPRPWKGVLEAARAVQRVPGAVLVVVGVDSSRYSRQVQALPGVRTVGMVPMSAIPRVMAAADVVVVPQNAHRITAVQVPSKLLDAMVLAKPIVATAVSDIPEILGDDRGRVVAPGDVEAMATALGELLDHPRCATSLGAAARRWAVENASLEAAREPLGRALEEAQASASAARSV